MQHRSLQQMLREKLNGHSRESEPTSGLQERQDLAIQLCRALGLEQEYQSEILLATDEMSRRRKVIHDMTKSAESGLAYMESASAKWESRAKACADHARKMGPHLHRLTPQDLSYVNTVAALLAHLPSTRDCATESCKTLRGALNLAWMMVMSEAEENVFVEAFRHLAQVNKLQELAQHALCGDVLAEIERNVTHAEDALGRLSASVGMDPDWADDENVPQDDHGSCFHHGVDPVDAYEDDHSPRAAMNPATGLPMAGTYDIGGNAFGTGQPAW